VVNKWKPQIVARARCRNANKVVNDQDALDEITHYRRPGTIAIRNRNYSPAIVSHPHRAADPHNAWRRAKDGRL